MPSRWTFTIDPIKQLLKEEITGGYWCDPFAGMNSPAQVRNDLNPEANAEFHQDALEFLRERGECEYDGVLYDPPYSFRQATECYKKFGREHLCSEVTMMNYWAKCKEQIARIIKPNGKAICFGWNTNGINMTSGFHMYRVLMVVHGGSQNDTLVTCERKLRSNHTLDL